ncbi:MAG: lamin tail domain-containing protein, partial [Bacteroidetes bacterium]|nr:lamin tail domain-containing protein [Bacteroidota bacterium]
MRRSLLTAWLLAFAAYAFAQTYTTIPIDGINSGWKNGEKFSNISSADTAYFTWDDSYLYFGISDAEADYENLATSMYIDTDPQGSNGSTAVWSVGGGDVVVPFKADYAIHWLNLFGADYIKVEKWNGSSWTTTHEVYSQLNINGDDFAFAIGADYRECLIKKAFIGNPEQIQISTFTEQEWDLGWRYFAWPSEDWVDANGYAFQSIPHSYGYTLNAGVIPNGPENLDAMFTPGNALTFDGVDDFIESGVYTTMATNVTMEAWVNWNGVETGNPEIIVNNGHTSLRGFGMFLNPGDNYDMSVIVGGVDILQTDFHLPINRWCHVALVNNAGNWEFYADGVSYPVLNFAWPNAPLISDKATIGANQNGAEVFPGKIDEVRIWTMPRSQMDIQTNMFDTIARTTPGLAAYYRFDQNPGSMVLEDVSPFNLDGFLQNFDIMTAWIGSYALVQPLNGTPTGVTPTGFTANWTAPAIGGAPTAYYLDVDDNRDFSSPVAGYDNANVGGVFTKDVTSLSENKWYYYRVRAYLDGNTGQSISSKIDSAKTGCSLALNIIEVAPDTCIGGNTGFAVVEGINGTPPLTYAWSNSTSNDTLFNVGIGEYYITLTDAAACVVEDTIEIFEPAALTTLSEIITPNDTIGGHSGAIDYEPAGGNPNYSYSWTGPATFNATTQDIADLEAGMYHLTVTDGCGETITEDYEVLDPQYCTENLYTDGCWDTDDIGIFEINTLSNITNDCLDDYNAHDYTFLSTNLQVGNSYTVRVGTNAILYNEGFGVWADFNKNGVYEDTEFLYSSPVAAPSPTIFEGPVSIPMTALLGTTTLRVRGFYDAVPQMDQACTEWDYGETEDYSIFLYDCPGFALNLSQTPASCFGEADGEAVVIATGANGGYTYLWSLGGQTDDTLKNAIAGRYHVTVTDMYGCVLEDSIDITQPALITGSSTEEICTGDSLFLAGAWQKVAGPYDDTYPAANGCDSVHTTNLSLLPVYFTPVAAEICQGETYTLPDMTTVGAPGVYPVTLTSEQNGCDSIVETTLTVWPSYDIQSDLYISEYVEGSSNNKAIEIFNPKTTSVNLADYQLKAAFNGATTASTLSLTGTLASGDVFVVANSSAPASTLAKADMTNATVMIFNGNDAVFLINTVTGDTLDIFGRIGENPGTSWTSGTYTTLDRTLVRKMHVRTGIHHNPASGFPTLQPEWDIYPRDTTMYLGSHNGFLNTVISDVEEICNGDSILLAGSYRKTPGIYTSNLTTSHGCDSIVKTNLIVKPLSFGNDVAEICAGDSIWLEGAWRKTAGDYFEVLVAANGCDSIVTVALSVKPTYLQNVNAEICAGEVHTLPDLTTVSIGGVYPVTLTAVNGCDSTIITDLLVKPVPYNIINVQLCAG